MKIFEKIYTVVSSIPEGKILTYKRVAEIAGAKNARIVGFALHKNKDPQNVPCHRVVRKDGSLARGYVFGGIKKQKELLQKEGILFENGKIKIEKYSHRN